MPKRAGRPLIHIWSPNLFQPKGGIQAFSQLFLQAVQQLYPQADYQVFTMHDWGNRDQGSSIQSSSTQVHYFGHIPHHLRRPAFAAKLLMLGLWQRPDLIITTHIHFTVVAHQLKRLTGVPYWAVAHGVEAWNVSRPNLRDGLAHARRILTVSHFTRNRLLQTQNLSPQRIEILPNTFDANSFNIESKSEALLKRYGLIENQPIILTVARLRQSEQYKGYDKILAALPTIRQALPNIHYLLVGKGDDEPRVRDLIVQYQLQACVTLTGFVPDPELSAHYNLCDVFAMPSKGEGFGIVYLEALACGKPTLGGNQDGAIDALCNGTLGALVDPDDVEAIAQALIQILTGTYPNPILYQPKLLRQKVIDTFGFEPFKRTLNGYLTQHFEGNRR